MPTSWSSTPSARTRRCPDPHARPDDAPHDGRSVGGELDLFRHRRGLRLRRNGEPVPTLSDALAALPSRLGVAIDIKDPAAGPAVVDTVRVANVESLRAAVVAAHGCGALHGGRGTRPGVITVPRSRDPARHREFLDDAAEVGARGVSAHWNALSPEFVDAATERGLAVYSWCKRRAALHEKIALPLAGIVTDWPSDLRRSLPGG